MSWILLIGVCSALGVALLLVAVRSADLARMRRAVAERDEAREQGEAEARLQFPVVDLSRCLGCATCVAVCPEGGVLDIVHGQAVVVNGSRCEGVSACERECPAGAIRVTIADLETRRDVPAINAGLEAVGTPGLFLAGEVTAHALIRVAVDHGTSVAREVAARRNGTPRANDALDLLIVGAGPAGLACALEAKRLGLRTVLIDQETEPGGTVAKYPRRKLVMTRPLELPLYGRLKKTTYAKEELVELWHRIAFEQGLDFHGGEVFRSVQRDADGSFQVDTSAGSYRAGAVCLALGRRGVPRRLGVPGEELAKVAYSLLDAGSFEGRRILVVGGGNSAVEAALGLAERNRVTLSYRRGAFFRLKPKNGERIDAALAAGRVEVVFDSHVRAIGSDDVELAVGTGQDARVLRVPNDEVFVLAGGVPPFELLERSGISFDPSLRPAVEPPRERGTGLIFALTAGFLLSLGALGFALWHGDYYALPEAARATHPKHDLLRPGRGLGLWLGVASVGLVALNLLYLVRRSPRFRFGLGSLSVWMTSHVATGILAFLCAALHSALAPGRSPGGRAFWALLVLLVTGAIGRYFYAWLPRAANGRELELAELRAAFGRGASDVPGARSFHERARAAVLALIEEKRWRGSFVGRAFALLGVQRGLRRVLDDVARRGHELGVPSNEIDETLRLARHTHRRALVLTHFEDLRALLGTWRFLHRWVALLMVLLVALHIVHALSYGSLGETLLEPLDLLPREGP